MFYNIVEIVQKEKEDNNIQSIIIASLSLFWK